MPQACTLMRTSPTPGAGISRSTIWKSAPPLGIWAAFIGAIAIFVVAMMPPTNLHLHHSNLCRETSIRSEEHTSELQSRLHLVCRLLLEKKKTSKLYTAEAVETVNINHHAYIRD